MDIGDGHKHPYCLFLAPQTLQWEGVLRDECVLDASLFLDMAYT